MSTAIIIEALEFERDHWLRLLDSRRQGWGSKSAMRAWATERVAALDAAISEMKVAA
jgi:hypothetical protein